MRFDQLEEGRNSKCIVIDVQPAYMGFKDYGLGKSYMPKLMQFLNNQGSILMFVNAEDQGMTQDSISNIKTYWKWHGFRRSWNDVETIDKGYGYLRSWMSDGIPDKIIIQSIREMYIQKVRMADELFDGNKQKFNSFFQTWIDDELWLKLMWQDPISIEWTSVAQLKRFNGAYLMGGGRNECLKEVTLLMNAFNIKYKVIEKFTYG